MHATGTALWAIANDDAGKLRALRDEQGLQFPILLDQDAVTIRAWGLLNEADGRGIPHPTVVILDRDGVVRWSFTETDYRLRPASAEIVARLREILD